MILAETFGAQDIACFSANSDRKSGFNPGRRYHWEIAPNRAWEGSIRAAGPLLANGQEHAKLHLL